MRVGDEGANYYKRDINKLYESMIEFYQKSNEEDRENVVKYLISWYHLIWLSIGNLTQKEGIYATFVSLIEQKIPSLSSEIIDRIFAEL